MKLFLLRPGEPKPDNWEPWYDCCFGFVVRAEDETGARQLAEESKGSEAAGAWLDPKLSSCDQLDETGAAEVIIADVHWA